jgi:hypothetical protein
MFICTLTVWGCSSRLFADFAANQSGTVQAANPAAGNALSVFAAGMPAGQTVTFNDPATHREVGVRVVRSYTSASGRECRDFLVIDSQTQEHLICDDANGWADVTPLVAASGSPAP